VDISLNILILEDHPSNVELSQDVPISLDSRRFLDDAGTQLLVKPFELEEFIARINAVLNKNDPSTEVN
jgi:hypothetical protein